MKKAVLILEILSMICSALVMGAKVKGKVDQFRNISNDKD